MPASPRSSSDFFISCLLSIDRFCFFVSFLSISSEVVTTILGSSQLDQFGAGSLNLVGPIVAIFSLFAYDRNRVYCRAILGLAPSTINTMIINNQVSSDLSILLLTN